MRTTLRTVLVAGAILLGAQGAHAAMPPVPEKIKLVDTVDASFGKVWNALKESMKEFGCTKAQVEKVEEPLEGSVGYSGNYRSDFCVMVTGADSTSDFMEQFGEMPRIRQSEWVNGRAQFTIRVKEIGVRKTTFSVECGLSGFEEFITNRVYFWDSNGVLEHRMRDWMMKYIAMETKE